MALRFIPLSLTITILSIALITTPINGEETTPEHYLIPHNKARADVGLPPLIWDPKIEEYARQTASQHGVNCELEHSVGGPYAENLAGGTGSVMTGTDATNMWVGEREFWNPETQTCAQGQECGHYLNIIASLTTRLGCAKIHCPNDGLIFQCDYASEDNKPQ